MSFHQHEILLFTNLSMGGEKAFRLLYDRYVHPVMKLCYFITRDHQLAKEACMDTFMVLWTMKAKVANMEKPQAWLYQTARNTAHNAVRRSGRYKSPLKELDDETGLSTDDADSSIRVEFHEFRRQLHTAISQLPPMQQEVVRLKLEGLDRAETAKRCGISEATVKNHLAVAYKKLRELMAGFRE